MMAVRRAARREPDTSASTAAPRRPCRRRPSPRNSTSSLNLRSRTHTAELFCSSTLLRSVLRDQHYATKPCSTTSNRTFPDTGVRKTYVSAHIRTCARGRGEGVEADLGIPLSLSGVKGAIMTRCDMLGTASSGEEILSDFLAAAGAGLRGKKRFTRRGLTKPGNHAPELHQPPCNNPVVTCADR